MEVHTHTHSQRKKFIHYLWEFLMLFLAVFCGFLAENIREHKVEKQRERQYINSLVQEIKSNSQLLETIDSTWEKNISACDSLLTLLSETNVFTNSLSAYKLWSSSTGFEDFIPNDGAIQQLKNSGGLRLLSSHDVVDSIMAYQRNMELLNVLQNYMRERQINDNIRDHLFNAVALYHANEKNNIPLLNSDKITLSEAFGYIKRWGSNFYWLREYAENVKNKSASLLKVIEKDYGIK